MNKSIEGLQYFWLQHRFRLIWNKSKGDSFSKKRTTELRDDLVLVLSKLFEKKLKKQNIVQLAVRIQSRLL